jgi:hypothetical protein
MEMVNAASPNNSSEKKMLETLHQLAPQQIQFIDLSGIETESDDEAVTDLTDSNRKRKSSSLALDLWTEYKRAGDRPAAPPPRPRMVTRAMVSDAISQYAAAPSEPASHEPVPLHLPSCSASSGGTSVGPVPDGRYDTSASVKEKISC